jgi:hypothetical protein
MRPVEAGAEEHAKKPWLQPAHGINLMLQQMQQAQRGDAELSKLQSSRAAATIFDTQKDGLLDAATPDPDADVNPIVGMRSTGSSSLRTGAVPGTVSSGVGITVLGKGGTMQRLLWSGCDGEASGHTGDFHVTTSASWLQSAPSLNAAGGGTRITQLSCS